MWKWIVIGLGVAALATFVIAQRNAVKVTYVNGLPAYNQLPNQEYIFQRDCYIFKLERWDTSYPLVGTHDSVPELPREVSSTLVGTNVGGARLLDIARVGDRFKIISVRREESRKQTFVTFEILFMNEQERKYPRLDAYFILDHAPESEGKAPQIIEDFAVPRVKA